MTVPRPAPVSELCLEDARVLVTGAGTGIGRATALEFARSGADVVLLGRTKTTLEAVASEIVELGRRSFVYVGDVRREEDVSEGFSLIEAEWGGLDVLVNNAGGQFPRFALDLSVAGWRSVVDLNLTGSFICSQAFAQSAVKRGARGAIVNMASAAPLRPTTGIAHSISARAGVIAMTRALALEWAPFGITVNAVAPGLVATSGLVNEELGGDSSAAERLACEVVPLMRAGTPEEVATTIVFIATRSYMTGETVVLDGGYSLGHGLNLRGDGTFA